MKFLNALEEAHHHVRTLWGVVLSLCVINVGLLLTLWHSQSHIKIHVPPYIPQSGLTLTQNQIPKTTIYSFAYYVWQSLNHWGSNGINDYKAQITQLSPLLTPTFKLKLIQNYNVLLNDGELQDRIRLMQGAEGSEYSPKNVAYLGHGTWVVKLTMRLTEMMNANAKVVKDVEMQYAFKIVRFDVDAKQNPWGLALAGFVEAPRRVKTFI